MFESIKKDPILKGITIGVLVIAVLGLIYYLFSSLFGFGSGYGMMTGNNRYGMTAGGTGYSMMGSTGYGLGLAGLLAVLLKLLLVVSVIGLIIGLVMYVKQSYGKEIVSKMSSIKMGIKPSVTCPYCSKITTGDFKYCPYCANLIKEVCSSCGTDSKEGWKCCPICGNEKETFSKEAFVENSTTKAEENQEGASEDIIAEIATETSTESSSNTGNV